MNYKAVLNILGRILQVEAALMLLPVTVALIYKEDPVYFLIVIAALLLCGTLLAVLTKTKGNGKKIFAREGFLIVALSWLFMSVFGCLPFVISKTIPSFVDAFFETVSGFTTTGASVLSGLDGMMKSMLFWRSFTHWIGGMGVLVFIMAVLPMANSRSVHIMRAETTGPTKGGKLVPKMRSTATILYAIYFGLTLTEVILLLIGGMNLFEALTYSFGTAGTGGFAISDAGIAGFDSDYILAVIGVFMFLFGVNFNIYYAVLLGNFKEFFKNEENRWYMSIVGGSTLLITLNVMSLFANFGKALLTSFFNVSSIMTTTGFTIVDFTQWPNFSQYILVVLMLCGACAGSTCGGIKMSRLVIVYKTIKRNIKSMLRPNQVEVIRLNGVVLDEASVRSTQNFFCIFILLLIASAFFVSLDGYDFTTSVTATISCLCNIGPGLSLVGPSGNFAIFSDPVKLLLVFDMLMGRLELYPILMLFIPAAWRRR